jgi:hypothetical protein
MSAFEESADSSIWRSKALNGAETDRRLVGLRSWDNNSGHSDMSKRMADTIIETLRATGVKRGYEIVGDTLERGYVQPPSQRQARHGRTTPRFFKPGLMRSHKNRV